MEPSLTRSGSREKLQAPQPSPAAHVRTRRSDFFVSLDEDVEEVKNQNQSNLQFRDLRCLQGISNSVLMVRRGSLVISLDVMRAVVTRGALYIVVQDGADAVLQPLLPRLESLKDIPELQDYPFELQALEAILYTVFNWHIDKVKRCLNKAHNILSNIDVILNDEILNQFAALQRSIDKELKHVEDVAKAVDEPQSNHSLMAQMFLASPNEQGNAELVESLLDGYSMVFEMMLLHLRSLDRDIDSLQDMVQLRLKIRRNRIIVADMRFTFATTVFAATALVGAFFGENLKSGLEPFQPASPSIATNAESPWPWMMVTLGSCSAAILTIGSVLICLHFSGLFR
uniref:Magnesium transporter n=1 Tax=Guillardia theta TaxID=55529 RepID=A0A7S4P2N3_GUITH